MITTVIMIAMMIVIITIEGRMYVWIYVCMDVWMYGCMGCMDVLCVWMCGCLDVCVYGCSISIWMHGCMGVWM